MGATEQASFESSECGPEKESIVLLVAPLRMKALAGLAENRMEVKDACKGQHRPRVTR